MITILDTLERRKIGICSYRGGAFRELNILAGGGELHHLLLKTLDLLLHLLKLQQYRFLHFEILIHHE